MHRSTTLVSGPEISLERAYREGTHLAYDTPRAQGSGREADTSILTSRILASPILTSPILTSPILTSRILTTPILTSPILTSRRLTDDILLHQPLSAFAQPGAQHPQTHLVGMKARTRRPGRGGHTHTHCPCVSQRCKESNQGRELCHPPYATHIGLEVREQFLELRSGRINTRSALPTSGTGTLPKIIRQDRSSHTLAIVQRAVTVYPGAVA
jgi:hypothetical protein